MNDFFDNINKNETGKLIHVGAGTGIDLKDYVTQSFAEILLLEPIPKVFKQLESKIEKLNKINVHCNITALNVALSSCADATKEKMFYITLPIRYSSLHKADKLKTIFQNLKTEQEITVSTINFSDLINQASLDKDKKNALVLQINGAEFEVLAQAKTDELMLFSSIVIQHSNNNYFEDAKTSTDLIALMKSKGFQLAIEADNDVVFSSLVFRKDESTLKLKALTEQSKTQVTRIAELENQLKASNEAKVSELTEARAKANASAEHSKTQSARIGELENQLKASNEAKANETNKANTSAEQNKTKTARVGELETQLKASNEAKASETNKANASVEQSKTQAARIGKLETQLKASNEAKASETNKANVSVEQSKTQVARIGELETQLKASNEAKASETNKANVSVEQSKTQAARIGELETQLKVSNEAKVSEVTEARAKATAKAEQSKTQAARIGELENQLKASNEAKANETNKANISVEQSKVQSVRIGELENQLKASNEAKTNETNKVNTSAEQSKTKIARIGELENQLKASNEAKTSESNKANVSAEQSKAQSARIGELEDQLQSSSEDANNLTEEKETLIRKRDELVYWNQEIKKNRELLSEKIDKLKVEQVDTSRSTKLGQKMLAKALIDLDHLRESYAVKVDNEKELIELIKELREKLTLASKYYIQLQKEHPELLISSNRNA
jgi:FkbM family methyltransferase